MPAHKNRSSWGVSLDVANIATVLVLIYAVLGAVIVILSAVLNHMDPALRMSFNQYLETMAVAAAGLAIGRGIKAAGKKE